MFTASILPQATRRVRALPRTNLPLAQSSSPTTMSIPDIWLDALSAAAKATQDTVMHLKLQPTCFDMNTGASLLQRCLNGEIDWSQPQDALNSVSTSFVGVDDAVIGTAAADAEPESPFSSGQEGNWIVIENMIKALLEKTEGNTEEFGQFLRTLDLRQGTEISVQLEAVLRAVCVASLDVIGGAQKAVEHGQRIRGYIPLLLQALQKISRRRDLESLFFNEDLQSAFDRLVAFTKMDSQKSPAVSNTSLVHERDLDGSCADLDELLTLWEDRGSLSPRSYPDYDAHIAWYLTRILDSRVALRLPSEKVQSFLDAVQHVLNCGSLPTGHGYNNMARNLVQTISVAHDQLPISIFIHDIYDEETDPTFHGGFAAIYRAAYRGRPVALKRIRTFATGIEKSLRSRFCREALIWQGFSHPFIVPFHGIDRRSFPSRLCLVSPWMKNGTITNYLTLHRTADIHRLTLEIAEGLNYLHSMNVVHGDLKGSNILITDDGNACLSDFGLAIMVAGGDAQITKITSSSNHAGSVRWTRETDVYAFACVCVELETGKPPFADVTEVHAMFNTSCGLRPERPNSMSETIWNVVHAAWAEDRRARPDTRKIISLIRGCEVETN
ncbi:kinase-like domain-containing protein [Favolaschia claudopus]|uniref:Kinase-like domain-containing protein n=1 Tax=Favolaschia claudopus TaxID=2862362 RepID=A0AAV9Z351_9AGAR